MPPREPRRPRSLYGDRSTYQLDWDAEDEPAYHAELARGVPPAEAEDRIESLVIRALDEEIWRVSDGKLVKEPPQRKAA